MPLFQILAKTPDFRQPLLGFMDFHGNEIITPQFLRNSQVVGEYFWDSGYALVQRPGEKQHIVINAHGETVFELPKDHKPVSFSPPDENGIFAVMHQIDVENRDHWKMHGHELVFQGETRYYGMRLDGSIAFEAYVLGASRGHYLISKSWNIKEKKGLMNRKGEIVIPPIYDVIFLSNTDPYATVMKDGFANIVTLEGAPIFPHSIKIERSTDLKRVVDGLWVVPNFDRDRADVFDVNSTEVIGSLPLTQWSATFPKECPSLSGGVACIYHPQKGSSYFFPDGRAAMPGILGRPRWFKPEMRSGYFYEGRASFKLGDAWGYLDLAGKHVIPPQFYSDLPFRRGLARVKYPSDGTSWDRFSYIDREGSVVWHQQD